MIEANTANVRICRSIGWIQYSSRFKGIRSASVHLLKLFAAIGTSCELDIGPPDKEPKVRSGEISAAGKARLLDADSYV